MANTFTVTKEALKRSFAVYVVKAQKAQKIYLYVGKTGDNREGCNPLISRCGNHFSYNKIHSQIRNKIPNHEEYEYKYYFDHFGNYSMQSSNRQSIDLINEMERWLNQLVQEMISNLDSEKVELLNVYKGVSANRAVCEERQRFRNKRRQNKLTKIIEVLRADIE